MVTALSSTDPDERYLAIIRNALRVCLTYKPAFGHGKSDGVSLERFQQIYREDEFYAWFGLDSPLVYAAHKAAGGMTSVYRQIGLSCQLVFQNVLQDTLGLSDADATWSYKVKAKGARHRTLTLDGRIPLDKITTEPNRKRAEAWLAEATEHVGLKGKNAMGWRAASSKPGRDTRATTRNDRTPTSPTPATPLRTATCR